MQPPQVGVLWTPGYWGWGGGPYLFHAGYWGPHIGFYGGVNYGFGYGGVGYEGGYWNHGSFAYNRSVNNVSNVSVTNVYNKTVINNTTVNRTSFNGGTGGSRPSRQHRSRLRFGRTIFSRLPPRCNTSTRRRAIPSCGHRSTVANLPSRRPRDRATSAARFQHARLAAR